jgi:GTP-binding protein
VRIDDAAFVTSAVEQVGYPPADLPEVCFAGRSNVGKSSLMNCLVSRRRLVKVSSTPGRTRLLNFFRVNEAWSLVDLPGYGFARVPKPMRAEFQRMVETYLSSRPTLFACVLLLDLRRNPEESERQMLEHLAAAEIKAIPVATKADKISRTARAGRLQSIADRLGLPPRAITPFSASSGEGRDVVWHRITSAWRARGVEGGDG